MRQKLLKTLRDTDAFTSKRKNNIIKTIKFKLFAKIHSYFEQSWKN